MSRKTLKKTGKLNEIMILKYNIKYIYLKGI